MNTRPLFKTHDLDQGQRFRGKLEDGTDYEVQLLEIREFRNTTSEAITRSEADFLINGETVTLTAGLYRLPQKVAGLQVDCPVTGCYLQDTHMNHWALEKDARIRIWPADSEWFSPMQFVHPLDQKLFASQTWFSNESVGRVSSEKFYYHAGMDFGGSEEQVAILTACESQVVAIGEKGEKDFPSDELPLRADRVYLKDERGWIYLYSHLCRIDDSIHLGDTLEAGREVGRLGKAGTSGGWSHLHFEIFSLQASGKWGTEDCYAFIWQAYLEREKPEVIAVARPRHSVRVGEELVLDASRSWSRGGSLKHSWICQDGTTQESIQLKRKYDRAGTYSELLKVEDESGNVSHDIATVVVHDQDDTTLTPLMLHACYHPTKEIRAGDPVTFKSRVFATQEGQEEWDFGDGSEKVSSISNTDTDPHAPQGYASVQHVFKQPGDYLVSVSRGAATDRLCVHVDE